MKKEYLLSILIVLVFTYTIQSQNPPNEEMPLVEPILEIEDIPRDAPRKRVNKAFDKERYQRQAKRYGIEIQTIYFGHNKTSITAVLVNTPKKLKEDKLKELQTNLNQVFAEYSSSVIYTLVKHGGKPYAVINAKKHYNYNRSKDWIIVYDYEESLKILKQKVQEFKEFLPTSKKLIGHEIIHIYYPLYAFPKTKSFFPRSLIVFTKDKNGKYHRFNFYGTKAGQLWGYRLENNRYYSTDARSDPQVQILLENGDMVNISLYYFDEHAKRYGGYFLKIE